MGNTPEATGEGRKMEPEHSDSSLRTEFLLRAAPGVRTTADLTRDAQLSPPDKAAGLCPRPVLPASLSLCGTYSLGKDRTLPLAVSVL